MSYFDDASLVMIPSGYKTSKVYSVKPTSGDGDLTFTRSNDTATRVGPDGLIEKVRTNQLLHSQAFDNAYWLKEVGGLASAPVVTANAELAPDGTMTAERIVFNLNGSNLSAAISQIASGTITLSAQANTSSIFLKTTDGTSKVFTMVNPDGGVKTITVTGTYQRFTNTSSGASSGGFRFRLRGGEGTADSASIAAWGAQLETGDIATSYIPTLGAAVSVGPVANVPRLDYLNSSCPRLLLEPQRSNLALFSEQFDNAYYNKTNFTVTANNATSPDGYVNADTLTSSAAGSFFSASVTFSDPSTVSFYVKYVSQQFVQIFSGASANAYANFDLVNGVVGSKGANASTSSITSVGNGWFRIVTTLTGFVGSSNFRLAFIASATSIWGASNADSNKSIQIWGAQLEAGAYATSYIPTLGSASTRGSDAASKTGISSLIGQTEGTLFAEVDIQSWVSGERILGISDGTTNNSVVLQKGTGVNTLRTISRLSNVLQVTIQSTTISGNTFKLAVAYKANDFVFYVNGVQIGTSTSASVPACSAVYLGKVESTADTNQLNDRISQALLFKTRLTNQELQDLTTL